MKRPWRWERLQAGGEGDNRGRDGWMASPTQWTWVWVNSGSWWCTGRPGVQQSMGSQSVWHNWATELDWLKAEWYSVVCTHRILVFPLSVGGLLGHFYLAVLNNAAVDKGMQIYPFETLLSVLLYICPEVELLDYMVILPLVFLREDSFLKNKLYYCPRLTQDLGPNYLQLHTWIADVRKVISHPCWTGRMPQCPGVWKTLSYPPGYPWQCFLLKW